MTDKPKVKPSGSSLRKPRFTASQAEMEAAFNSISEPVMLLGSDYTIKWANKATATFLDLPMNKIAGGYCYKLMHGMDKPAENCPLAKMVKSKKHEGAELYLEQKKIWAQVTVDPQYDQKGNLINIVHTVNDITKRKQVEEALHASERDFRLLASFSNQLNDIFISFTESSDTLGLFNRIAESLRNLTGAIAASFALYYPEAHNLKVVSLSTDPPSSQKANSIFGPGLFEMRMPVSAEVMEDMLSKGIWRPKDLHELSFGVMPQDISDAIMESVGCRQIVALAVHYAAELVGTCIAYLPTDQPVVPDDALRTFSYISGLAVKRKQAEEALRLSEAQYRLLAEHTTDTVWMMDMDLKTTYRSNSAQKIRGYTSQEILEMPLERNMTPESFKLVSEAFLREVPKVQSDASYNPVIKLELEYYCKDGTTAWAENTFSVIRDASGKPVSILGESRNITERKKTEDALKASEALYRLLSEHTTDTVWLMDMDLNTTYHSPSVTKIRGFTPQEVIKMSLEQNLTPESLKSATELFLNELPRVEADPGYNPVRTLDLEYYCKDGSTRWAENKFSIIRDSNGKPVSILGEARDITERKQAEEALRENEAKYRSLVELSQDLIAIHQQGKIVFINEAGVRLLGASSPNQIIGRSVFEFVPQSQKDGSQLRVQRALREGKSPLYEQKLCRLDETELDIEVMGTVCSFHGDVAVQLVARDITERKKAEEAVRESEWRFKNIFEHVSDIFYMQNTDQQIIYVSPQVEQVLGYTVKEILNRRQYYLTDSSLNLIADQRTETAIRTGEKQEPYLLEFMHKDGTKRLG